MSSTTLTPVPDWQAHLGQAEPSSQVTLFAGSILDINFEIMKVDISSDGSLEVCYTSVMSHDHTHWDNDFENPAALHDYLNDEGSNFQDGPAYIAS